MADPQIPAPAAPVAAPTPVPTGNDVAPTPAPTSYSDSGGDADYSPAIDDAAALATYRELSRPVPEAAPEPEAAPVGSALPVPELSSSAEDGLSPEDAKLARVLNRITRLEDDRTQAQKQLAERDAELAKLRERAKFADEYDRDLARFAEDPETFFRKVKWDAEKMRDYVVNGPKAVDAATSQLSREQAELKTRLEKFEAAEAQRAQAAREADFKSGLARQLEGKAEKYPFATAFYSTPAELSDALYAVMAQTYRTQNRELTADETAQVLETTLSAHAEKLNRARKPTAAGTPAAAPTSSSKPSFPTLSNTPPASVTPTKDTNSDSDDDLLAAAAAALRRSRAAVA